MWQSVRDAWGLDGFVLRLQGLFVSNQSIPFEESFNSIKLLVHFKSWETVETLASNKSFVEDLYLPVSASTKVGKPAAVEIPAPATTTMDWLLSISSKSLISIVMRKRFLKCIILGISLATLSSCPNHLRLNQQVFSILFGVLTTWRLSHTSLFLPKWMTSDSEKKNFFSRK